MTGVGEHLQQQDRQHDVAGGLRVAARTRAEGKREQLVQT
jgi:hypothetical protein